MVKHWFAGYKTYSVTKKVVHLFKTHASVIQWYYFEFSNLPRPAYWEAHFLVTNDGAMDAGRENF